jgi:hypothetical protein
MPGRSESALIFNVTGERVVMGSVKPQSEKMIFNVSIRVLAESGQSRGRWRLRSFSFSSLPLILGRD